MKNSLFLLMTLSAINLLAQENLQYQVPPASILELADYQRPATVTMDSKKEWMLYIQYPTYKSLQDLGQEEMRLGGLRINPTLRIASTTTYATNLQLGRVGELSPMPIQGMPNNPRLAYISWSPDEKHIAFVHATEEGIELWVVNVATQTAKKLSADNLNGSMGSPFTWYADSKALLVRKRVPGTLQDRSKDLPTGPVVSTSEGKASQNRTYQDLLKNPTDEHNFVVLCTSSLHRIALEGEEKQVLPPNLYADESFSPDGKYLLVEHIETPFSYIVPYYRFPTVSTVYRNSTYQVVKEVNRTPLIEIMPKGFMATSPHKRSMGWRPDQPATLSYAQALDGGDPAQEVPFRDALYTWEAPFSAEPKLMAKIPQRYGGVMWGNEEHAFLIDQWYDTRSLRTYHFAPGKPGKDLKLVWDRNYQDRYSDPGNFETERNQFGKRVMAIRNGMAFLRGDGYTPEGQFPFLDKMDLKSFKTTRVYRSEYTDRIERLVSVEDFENLKLLVNIQSATQYPNYFFRDLKSGTLTPVTNFENPFKSLGNVKKEVITYTRKDGIELSGTLYLPANYNPEKDGQLPLLIWAYPVEYKDRNSASQNTQNPNEFTYPYYGSFVYWVNRGYAVLDDAAFPILGEGSAEPNDNFLEQLVANAEAAIDAVANKGIADRKRVAIGGHSYGAFMTANLLTHSNLFACGIARSGAYNRTLTPFGFQSEQRNYWDVPEVYNGMSPFQNASKMKTPLLLVHGEADNNPGTFTLQTERYFQALKGLGAPVRMVILPKESHGYAAKENILHLLWEQDQFLEKYLK